MHRHHHLHTFGCASVGCSQCNSGAAMHGKRARVCMTVNWWSVGRSVGHRHCGAINLVRVRAPESLVGPTTFTPAMRRALASHGRLCGQSTINTHGAYTQHTFTRPNIRASLMKPQFLQLIDVVIMSLLSSRCYIVNVDSFDGAHVCRQHRNCHIYIFVRAIVNKIDRNKQ